MLTGKYAIDKVVQASLEADVKAAGNALKKYPRMANGLTPDNVKATDEWKADRQASKRAFASLQQFNKLFCKRYKAEIKAERCAA